MKPKTYSINSFNALRNEDKWTAYESLLKYLNTLQSKLDNKRLLVSDQASKIDFLREARANLKQQRERRDRAGALARSAAYEAREEEVIAIYLELLQMNGSVAATTVHHVYTQRWTRDPLTVRTVRGYIREYKQNQTA